MLYALHALWSDICVCVFCQQLLWFLPVRFCTQQLLLPGPPTAWWACLHRPSSTVWSWWVMTRSWHPTNAARCSRESNRWDSFVVYLSPFNILSGVFNSRLCRVVFPPPSMSWYCVSALSLLDPSGTACAYEDIRPRLGLLPVCDRSAGRDHGRAVNGGPEPRPTDWAKEHRCCGCCQCLEQQTGSSQHNT